MPVGPSPHPSLPPQEEGERCLLTNRVPNRIDLPPRRGKGTGGRQLQKVDPLPRQDAAREPVQVTRSHNRQGLV
jgi:hypothetical protein